MLKADPVLAKVKQIVQAMSKPVGRAIDWVIDKLVTLIKKLLPKSKTKPKPDKKKPTPDKKKRPTDRDKPRRDDASLHCATSTATGLLPEYSSICCSRSIG